MQILCVTWIACRPDVILEWTPKPYCSSVIAVHAVTFLSSWDVHQKGITLNGCDSSACRDLSRPWPRVPAEECQSC